MMLNDPKQTYRLSNFSKEVLMNINEYCQIIGRAVIDPYLAFKYGPDTEIVKKYYTAINNLTRCGYLKRHKTTKTKKRYYALTSKAKRALAIYQLKTNIIKKKWDGKWYLLIFDIPERKRYYRDRLRRDLLMLGFYQLQKSVWLFPYDVLRYLYELLPGFREGDWFHYMEINKINPQLESKLIKLFDLSKK